MDDRGRIQFTNIVVIFATFVSFGAVAPWIYEAIGMAQGPLDPFSALLLSLALPLMLVSLLISVGVSARTGG
jgi:hypothetical protein